MISKDFELKEE